MVGRVYTELTGLNATNSKAATNTWYQVQPGRTQQSLVVRYATLKRNSTMLTEPRTAAHQEHFSITHWTDPTYKPRWGRCIAGLTCQKIKHLAILNHIACYLVDEMKCAWQFQVHKAPTLVFAFAYSDWASNEEDRRSVDSVHIFFWRTLLKTSTCSSKWQLLTLVSRSSAGFSAALHPHCKSDNSSLR